MTAIGSIGLAELVIVLFILLTPGAIIYLDARKKGRNKYFWTLTVIFGLLMGFIPGLLIILIYLLYPHYRKDFNETNHGESGDKDNKRTHLSNSELERVLKIFNENERRVLEVLMKSNDISQNEIAAKTGLSSPTISRILNKLENKGIIVRYRDGMSKKVKLKDDFFR